jgi:uncharacterized protein YcfJ
MLACGAPAGGVVGDDVGFDVGLDVGFDVGPVVGELNGGFDPPPPHAENVATATIEAATTASTCRLMKCFT